MPRQPHLGSRLRKITSGRFIEDNLLRTPPFILQAFFPLYIQLVKIYLLLLPLPLFNQKCQAGRYINYQAE
jgi:hypothetical protein